MKPKKLINAGRAILLGIIGGVFLTAVLVALERINFYYATLRYEDNLREAERMFEETGTHPLIYNPQPQQLWWINAALMNIALFTIASLVVHAALAKKIKSVFQIWASVGGLVIVEWGVIVVGIDIIESLVTGKSLSSLLMLSASQGQTLIWFVVLTIGMSLIFGILLKIATMQYCLNSSEDASSKQAV